MLISHILTLLRNWIIITIWPQTGRNAFTFKKLLIYEKVLFWTQNHLLAHNNTKNKGKHTQLFCSPPFSQVICFSKCFSPSVTLQALWTMVHGIKTTPTTLQLSYKFLVLGSWEKLKSATDWELPITKGPWWKKSSHSKPKIFYGRLSSPIFSQVAITKPETNIYCCLVWPASDNSGLQKRPEILIFKCISYWVILPLGSSGSEAWMPLQIPCSLLRWTHTYFDRIRSIN